MAMKGQLSVFGTLMKPAEQLKVNWLACKESTCAGQRIAALWSAQRWDFRAYFQMLQDRLPKTE